MDPDKDSKIQNVSRVAMNIVSIPDVSSCDTLHTAASFVSQIYVYCLKILVLSGVTLCCRASFAEVVRNLTFR